MGSMASPAAAAALLLLLLAMQLAAVAASARQLQARTIYPPDPVAAAGRAKKAGGGKPSEGAVGLRAVLYAIALCSCRPCAWRRHKSALLRLPCQSPSQLTRRCCPPESLTASLPASLCSRHVHRPAASGGPTLHHTLAVAG